MLTNVLSKKGKYIYRKGCNKKQAPHLLNEVGSPIRDFTDSDRGDNLDRTSL